jgi:hypothetical protein
MFEKIKTILGGIVLLYVVFTFVNKEVQLKYHARYTVAYFSEKKNREWYFYYYVNGVRYESWTRDCSLNKNERYYVKFSSINPDYVYFYCEPTVPAGFHVIPSEGWDFLP